MTKEVIGRGWLTVTAIKDGKDGATGAKGDKGDDAGVMTFSPATLALSAVRKTDGSYVATVGDAAKAQARVMLGTTDVTNKCSYVVVQSVNCTATVAWVASLLLLRYRARRSTALLCLIPMRWYRCVPHMLPRSRRMMLRCMLRWR